MVSKGNSDEIAKAIILLLSDRILRTKLSENLRAMSKRNNWENVAIRMLELYTQLES
jgi:glycosyltransferase involved in cell wall biosynthesis